MLEAVLEIGAVPGDSAVHRLWAGTKLVAPVAVAIALAISGSIWGHLVAAALLVLGIVVARLSPGLVWRGLRPLLFALSFAVTLLLFKTDGQPLLHLGPAVITRQGVEHAIKLPGLLLILATSAALVNRTTPPAASVAALGVLLYPLRWLRFPVDELLTMCAISLRFLPILAEEVTRLRQAQATRGLSLGQGSLDSRSKAIEGWIAALISANLRRADELGEAMNARGYGDPEAREFPVQRPRLGRGDALVFAGALGFIVALIMIK